MIRVTPTLTALQKFDAAHRKDAATLSDVGLILLRPPERAWCDDSPKNGHIFATTGGDSVHFCLLEVAGRLTDESPVVMVVPCNSDAPRLVVGDTLRDFLSLGSTIGYFFLEQLVYDFDRTLGYLFDYDAFNRHNYDGAEPPDDDLEDLAARRALLAALSREFGLTPWPDARARFDALQKKWSSQVELVS
jgi:hypothetical protein